MVSAEIENLSWREVKCVLKYDLIENVFSDFEVFSFRVYRHRALLLVLGATVMLSGVRFGASVLKCVSP